jgi:PAS domain S-box-containing protein
LVIIPLIALSIIAGNSTITNIKKDSAFKDLNTVVILSTKISALVHETQKERGATAGFIGSKGKKFVDTLPNQRKLTNVRIKELQKFLTSVNLGAIDSNIANTVNGAMNDLSNIETIRTNVSGYSKEELIGQNHNIVRHPDMSKEFFKDMWDALKLQTCVKAEVKNLKKDGSFYWVDAKIEPDYDTLGNHIGYSSLRIDITAKKELEELSSNLEQRITARTQELHSERNFINSIINSSQDALIVIDKDSIVTTWNNSAVHIFGYTKDEMIGNSIEKIIPKKFRELHHAGVNRVSSNGEEKLLKKGAIEIEGLHKDGTTISIDLSLNKFLIDNQLFFSANIRDISERKILTDKLKEEKQFVQTLVDSQEQIIVTTKDGSIKSVNETFLDFFAVDDINEFKKTYDADCICDTFNKNAPEGYLQKNMNGTSWIEHLIFNTNNETNKVMISLFNKNWVFSVSAANLPNEEGLKSAVFTDITEIEEAKKEIESIHKHTKESIQYAALIQGALIPNNQLFRNYFKDHFILWHPKDTVGGDIYLFEQLRDEDECLLMVIDCTGHGVPGAFVTMLVKAVEREVIAKIKSDRNIDVSPAWIMGYFNKTLKKLLKQEDKSSLSNAGFDGGIIYYNKKTQILKFCGAYTPLFYIDEHNEFKTIQGNKYSVGYKKCDSNYLYQETILNVKKGMKFYCTTDGYLDQNGGEKDFPFGKKRFSNIIKKYHKKSMADQQTAFLFEMMKYENMIENNDRNDDMTVIAFEIKQSDSKDTILEYDGVLTQSIISHSMDILEYNISNLSLRGKVTTIVVEISQNMMKYSKSHDIHCNDIRPAGFIEVTKDINNIYYINSKNILSKEDKDKIELIIKQIQSLTLQEIKTRYKDLRRSRENKHKNGGGIGLYEVAKSATTINYSFKKINDSKFEFEFNLTVKGKSVA